MLDFRVTTFLTVCETMNYTKAAQLLHITQPAVSQHIHFLEKYYDTRLVISEHKKLELTPQGALLYKALSTISHDTDILKQQFLELEQKQFKIHLGSTLTIGEFVLKNPLIHYIKTHPGVTLDYTIADTQVLLQKLSHGEIDLALIEGYYQKQDFDSYLFRQESFFPVCSTDYPLKGANIALTDLLNEPLLIREKGSGTRNVLEHYLKEYHLSVSDFDKVYEINNLNVIRAAAVEGCGITFLFCSVVYDDLIKGRLRPLSVKGFPVNHDFTFIWQKNSIHKQWYLDLCETFSKQAPNTIL